MAIAGFAFAKNIFQKALSPMPAMLNHVQLELLASDLRARHRSSLVHLATHGV
jgi:hypothetical protein